MKISKFYCFEAHLEKIDLYIFQLEIQNGVKIKEEPIDTTSNTITTEDYMLVRNCYSLIDHNYHCDKSVFKNDVLSKDINNTDINNTEIRHSSNDDSTHSNDVKTVNKEHKNANPEKEINDTLSQVKKRKYSTEDSNNKNTNVLDSTTENIKGKRKQNIILDCKTKVQGRNKLAKKKLITCDICFRKFPSFRNCIIHKQYYEISDNICRICKKHFAGDEKLQSNMCSKHSTYIVKYKHKRYCHFCSRPFKRKALLQSHLFHIHNSELIYFNKIEHKSFKSENINTSPKGDTLRTSANKESCSNNLREDNLISEKISTTFINNVNKSCDDNMMNTDKSGIEKSFSNDMSPTKRLRQPTLTEYLELCKKKRDIKLSPNKFNIMKDDFSVCSLRHNEQIERNSGSPKHVLFPEEHNDQIDSLSTKSNNFPKQIIPSILKQTTAEQEISKKEIFKKPFVRIHADVEIMKSFLKKLSDTAKDKVTEDGTSDREIPYRLRSLSGVSSMEAGSNSRMRKNKRLSEKSRVNIEFSKKQNIIDEVEAEANWKIIMGHFKCKECTIPLIRCDEQPKNSHQISTFDAMKDTSLTTQCNSTLFQENDVRNEIILKDLEVSLERLTSIPTIDTKVKTELDEKQNNNYFSCKVCKKSFSSKLAKRVHIKSTHIAYMSSICNARYTLKHKLLQHYLCEHLVKQNQCCVCYMLLPNYEAVKQHLSVHCLKYIQKENDQYPIDIELKCNLTKKPCKCLHCNETFSIQSYLETHQSYCIVQKEVEKDKNDFTEKASTCPKDIPEIQHKENTDKNIVTCDERINLDDSCKSLNNGCGEEKLNESQISLHSEKEPEINEVNRNCLVNDNLTEKKIESINESQNLKKLSENNNSTISNSTISNQNIAQLGEIATRTMTYPCDICGKQFHNSKNLKIHKRTFNFTTDICPMCGTGFSSKRLLQTHITAAHVPHISKTYSFHCVFCNQGFFKKHDLRPHILHLHGQQVLNTLTRNLNMSQEEANHPSVIHTVMCNICNLMFETHDRYVEHRMYYYQNHTFTCSLCNKNFQGMYMFHHHNKLVHYSEDKRKSYSYICDICKEGFNHESHFYSHNMHVHSKEVNLVETGKEFEQQHRSNFSLDVQNKIRNISTDQRKQNEQPSNEYTCEVCQLKCTGLNHMLQHKEFYSNDGDFRCDKCNRRCRTFYLLDQHRKLTHLYRDIYKEYACHICGEVLKTVNELKCHEKHFHSNITGNNMDNWKNCDQISSSNITCKIMEHLYKSNTCNVSEYNCLFCDMKFPTANTAQTHIVHVHMDDMIAKRTILKLTLPIIDNDDIQKLFVETDPASSSSSSSTLSITSSSSSSSVISSSEDNLSQPFQRPKIQQSTTSILGNILSNTTTENKITDKTTIKLLKEFRTACSKNNTITITEKTPISVISCTNTSKDISTASTIAPNTKSKTDISVSTPTGSTISKTITPSVKLGNNTSVFPSGFTTSKTIVSNTESKDNTSVPLAGSTDDLQKSYRMYLKSGLINEFKANSVSSNRPTTINKSKTVLVTPLATESLSTFKVGSTVKLVMPQNWKSNEITNQKFEQFKVSMKNYGHGYSCPLCPLEYPSLIFFHAHLKYAHADSIRTNEPIVSRNSSFQVQKTSMIECLLCPLTFIDETKYKQHLRNSHTYYVYIPTSEEMTKINDVRNPLTPTKNKTNINSKSTIPETITVDDNDDENIKNTSHQRIAEVTAIPDRTQNEKIGKLRVKPFAKIIENLSMDSALEL